jgi:hypothetical protein
MKKKELTKKLDEINLNYSKLLSGQNKDYNEGVEFIEKETKKRLDVIKENKENEIVASDKAFHSQIKYTEDNYNRNVSEINKQFYDILKYKLDDLNKSFPKFAKYVSDFDVPVKELFKNESKEKEGFVKYEGNEETLLSKKEISDDLSLVASFDKPYQASKGVLSHGKDNFFVGKNCKLIIGDECYIFGELVDVKPLTIDFETDNGKMLTIPLESFNLGLVRMSKT